MSANKDIKALVIDLLSEFSREKSKFKNKYDSNCERIEEIDRDIEELQHYDDDRQIFSPRVLTSSNDIKLMGLREEKDNLSEENTYLLSRLKYFSEKVDLIESVLEQEKETESEEFVDSDNTNETIDDLERNKQDKDIDTVQNNDSISDNKSKENVLDVNIKSEKESREESDKVTIADELNYDERILSSDRENIVINSDKQNSIENSSVGQTSISTANEKSLDAPSSISINNDSSLGNGNLYDPNVREPLSEQDKHFENYVAVDRNIYDKVIYKLKLSLQFIEQDPKRTSLEIQSAIQLLNDL